ncbi:hypothetical protein ACIRJO_17990 [Streptomyces sp. NPDC102394]|uniref:hypothetical protein n=1 Tax=Streptomyces sp. NPDC102394 TaxID=3366167 RepID=UPI0037F90B5D
MTAERFHLTLTAAGQPAMHGWWAGEVTARGKFTRWVGDWGRDGVCIVLTDEETGRTLETWPEAVLSSRG